MTGVRVAILPGGKVAAREVGARLYGGVDARGFFGVVSHGDGAPWR